MNKQKKVTKNEFFRSNGINLIFIVVGVVLILSARSPYGYKWGENVLDGIGCSCISAAIMAFFINQLQMAEDRKKVDSFKKLYFRNLYERLSEMLQRILWFDERWKDVDFNWNLDEREYGSLNYMLFSYQRYKSDEKLDFEELQNRIELCSKKYSAENVFNLNEEELAKLHKMIKIILVNSTDVLDERNKVDSDKLMICNLAKLDLEKINSIISKIDMAFNIFCANGKKAYGVGYELIFKSFAELREWCEVNNEVTIALRGTIRAGEL